MCPRGDRKNGIPLEFEPINSGEFDMKKIQKKINRPSEHVHVQ